MTPLDEKTVSTGDVTHAQCCQIFTVAVQHSYVYEIDYRNLR